MAIISRRSRECERKPATVLMECKRNNKGGKKKSQGKKAVCCTLSELQKCFGRTQWQERSPEKNSMAQKWGKEVKEKGKHHWVLY